jgi:hypothetical protein
MTQNIRKFRDLIDPVVQFSLDAGEAEENVDANDTQYNRRALVRALFAMIEGTVYFLKQTILSANSGKKNVLTPADLILLQDAIADIDSQGHPCLRPRYIRLKENLRFVSHIISNLYGVNMDLGLGSAAWQHFDQAISIRNRITHPKDPREFLVSHSDIQIIREVSSWFSTLTVHTIEELHHAVVAPRLQSILADLDELDALVTRPSMPRSAAEVLRAHIAGIRTSVQDVLRRKRSGS